MEKKKKIGEALFLLIAMVMVALSECEESGSPNKFRQREATDDALPYPNLDEDALANSQCPQHVELRWQAEVSSSIYAAPLIADINGDGKLDIVVSSFVHNLEVLDGSDGDKLPGWPVSHQSTSHSSPLMYDLDKDGVREIALATYNGEILFFRPSGYMMVEKLVVPRTREKKDWYVGLKQDHADRTHPDVHDDSLVPEASSQASKTDDADVKASGNISVNSGTVKSSVSTENNLQKVNNESIPTAGDFSNSTNVDIPSNFTHTNESKTDSGGEGNVTLANPEKSHVGIDADIGHGGLLGNDLQMAAASVNGSHSGGGGSSNQSQRRLLEDAVSKDSMKEQAEGGESTPTAKNEQALEDVADASFELFRDEEENMEDGLTEEYQYDYDDYVDETMWGHEDWKEAEHEKEEDYVNIDAHILCTPVIADIDKDGIDEMIVAVSYFFDREYYDKPEHAAELGGLDITKYVKNAIVVFNLDTKQIKWTSVLDLSTDEGSYRAYVYSSPSVVDLDGDGYLDIVVGTSFGYCYVLDHHGQTREKFPLQMAEIQGQVLVADINDDGKIELVTTDTHGNVAAWTSQGTEIWEVHLKSLISQGPTAGDVDGDGHTDVVIPTVSGKIFVLKGLDGSYVNPHPFHTHGRIMAPVLLMDSSIPGDERKGLLLVVTSFDGYLYLIDGRTACADVIDIGETSYSMTLAENVDGGNDLELIVTTMNGNVFCFSTPLPYHPLKAWPSQNQGRNVLTNRYKREGIFVAPSSRTFHDEEGDSFWLQFSIIDQYRVPSGSQGPYNVTVTLLVPGNYMGSKKITETRLFDQPGTHQFRLPSVPVRTTGSVLVEMVDRNGLYFSDEFVLTFHMHYYRLLKWLILLPMMAMFAVLLFLQPQEASPLPSFSRDRHQL